MQDKIKAELSNSNIQFNNIEEIQTKDGVSVWRVFAENTNYIIKYFDNNEFCREIFNYKILSEIGVQTLKIIHFGAKYIVLEDINISETLRLGNEADLDDDSVAKLLAKWYKHLHSKGREYLQDNRVKLYSENEIITKENLLYISRKTNTENAPFWSYMFANLDKFLEIISKLNYTITYNDFYYTNLVVSKNKDIAFMFDYNMLGKGYAYADIRNVCYSLSDGAKRAFLKVYGNFDEKEKLVDDVASTFTALYIACGKKVFPKYAENLVNDIVSGNLLKKLHTLFNYDIQ